MGEIKPKRIRKRPAQVPDSVVAEVEAVHASSLTIVGIGASAGGLEALSQLLPALPRDLGLSFVVVQHLSPTYRSMMAQLLSRETPMLVQEIQDGAVPQPNVVYITPPNRNVTLHDGTFHLGSIRKLNYVPESPVMRRRRCRWPRRMPIRGK